MIGTTLAHYRILDKLGAGGMGEVYHAHDEQLDREVALKVLPASSFSDPAARARLLREARSAAALNHPNICTIYEVGDADGQAYIAMELVEGKSLSDVLGPEGLPPETVLRCISHIADALEHAHGHGIVHRDLKCANVMLTPEGRVKVLDFGLAKRITGENPSEAVTRSQPSLTQAGTLIGTLAYMAPEQLRGERADARSDIWALGVVLYEMATGSRPFKGATAFDLCSAILGREPEAPPAKLRAELRAVIDRCLAKDPSQRYQHAGEVGAALEAIQTGNVSPWLGWHYRLRSRPALALAGAFLAAVALVAAWYVGGLRSRLAGGAGAPKIASLAVLPLENLSGDPAQDYLASGIQEALITDLARLSGIRKVIARSSVMRYRQTDSPLPQIARELGVAALITGSVMRSGDRVQVTAHLIDCATQEQLWANRYEREMRDALALVDDIVGAITKSIRLRLTPTEQARLSSAPTLNPEAYEAYLQGRFHQFKQTQADFDIAEKYYRLALEKAPEYAPAYVGLGIVNMMRADAGFTAPSETFPKAVAFLKKAESIDDSSAEVHVWLGNMDGAVKWDWAGAEKELRRAIELNPQDADAHFFYADLLLSTKKDVAGWGPEMQRALELDPLSEFKRTYYGWHLNYLHRYDEAIPIFEKLLPTAPNKAANYLGLWGAFYEQGKFDDAIAAAKSYFTTTGDTRFAEALGSGGGETAYRVAMRRVGRLMVKTSTHRHVPAIRVARMFAHAGDKDAAMAWLEKAYEARESPMTRIAVFWDWDSLRSDPRFQDLLRRMKLPL
jgi:TolB-like protein/Tfp pilus assembly protein PilF